MEIAILGLGTVGTGALEVSKSSSLVHVKRALVHSPRPDQKRLTTTNYDEILNDDSIKIVCECIGGIHPAYEYVMSALEHGKHVVTPNKELMSTHYTEITECAHKNGCQVRFTASAGGGIPWLFNLARTKRCDEIEEVSGIINGTCNYILDRMTREGADFDEVLKDAQEKGYAEADPTADIDGFDTLHKCALSANVAFDMHFSESRIPVSGIRHITADDIKLFDKSGCVCRLMMHAGRVGSSFYAYVEPTLIAKNTLAAAVPLNYNLVTLKGKNIGVQSFYGEGAGKMPTGTSVIQDAIDIAETDRLKAHVSSGMPWQTSAKIDNDKVKHSYYMRRGKEQHSVTEPMTVAAAHRLYEIARADGDVFMAGIEE